MKFLNTLGVILQVSFILMAVRAALMFSDWQQGCFWLLADISATLMTMSARVK